MPSSNPLPPKENALFKRILVSGQKSFFGLIKRGKATKMHQIGLELHGWVVKIVSTSPDSPVVGQDVT